MPCTGMQKQSALNRFIIKHAFWPYIYSDSSRRYGTLKSYLILNKYMVKNRVLWCIYLEYLGFNALHSNTRHYGNAYKYTVNAR